MNFCPNYYKVQVTHIDVHKWSNETGQGDYVCSKGGFTIGYFDTISDAKAELADWFGDSEPDYAAYDGEEFLSVSIIENADAYQSDKGEYIADYTIGLQFLSRVIWREAA